MLPCQKIEFCVTKVARPYSSVTCTNKFHLACYVEDVEMEADKAIVVLTPTHSGDDSDVSSDESPLSFDQERCSEKFQAGADEGGVENTDNSTAVGSGGRKKW